MLLHAQRFSPWAAPAGRARAPAGRARAVPPLHAVRSDEEASTGVRCARASSRQLQSVG